MHCNMNTNMIHYFISSNWIELFQNKLGIYGINLLFLIETIMVPPQSDTEELTAKEIEVYFFKKKDGKSYFKWLSDWNGEEQIKENETYLHSIRCF